MNVRILVLSILLNRPAHGYEIQQYLHYSDAEHWADVLPGSIYHALKKMKIEGWVKIVRTEWEGKRARDVYEITPRGREAFHELLLQAWNETPRGLPTALYVAVTFMGNLPKETVMARIDAHTHTLQNAQCLMNALAKEDVSDVPVQLKCIFHNMEQHLRADLELLKSLQEWTAQTDPQPLDLPPLKDVIARHTQMEKYLSSIHLNGVQKGDDTVVGSNET